MVQRWWERYRGRLEYELAELDRLAVAHSVDEDAKAAGRLQLTLVWDAPGIGPTELVAIFPELYPYYRPEVSAAQLDLGHHQNPFTKYLCLAGRSTVHWGPHNTLAGWLSEQLGKAVDAGTERPRTAAEQDQLEEEHQAEPFSEYYTCDVGAMFLIDGAWSLPGDCSAGQLDLHVNGPFPRATEEAVHVLGMVATLYDNQGGVLAQAPEGLAQKFANARQLKGRWCRLPEPVRSNDAKDLWLAAAAVDPIEPPIQNTNTRRRVQIRGMIFPEETAWRESSEGWVFVIRAAGVAGVAQSKKQRGRGGKKALPQTPPYDYWIIRVGRAGPGDLAARVPALTDLSDRSALVVGAGALGSTVADQLARAGLGTLHVLDADHLDPGNTVRHTAWVMQSGLPKSAAVAYNATLRSPYLHADCAVTRLGQPPDPAVISDAAELDRLLEGMDILIDASAEVGVQQHLAEEAATRGIPYLLVSATNGGWGGMVALIEPQHTKGCWGCLQYHLDEKSIPTPPEDPAPPIQPHGCADPTFTGTGFDLDQTALHAVRVAVGCLLRGTNDGYRSPDTDVAVLALRDEQGNPILPTWSGYPLDEHPKCESH